MNCIHRRGSECKKYKGLELLDMCVEDSCAEPINYKDFVEKNEARGIYLRLDKECGVHIRSEKTPNSGATDDK